MKENLWNEGLEGKRIIWPKSVVSFDVPASSAVELQWNFRLVCCQARALNIDCQIPDAAEKVCSRTPAYWDLQASLEPTNLPPCYRRCSVRRQPWRHYCKQPEARFYAAARNNTKASLVSTRDTEQKLLFIVWIQVYPCLKTPAVSKKSIQCICRLVLTRKILTWCSQALMRVITELFSVLLHRNFPSLHTPLPNAIVQGSINLPHAEAVIQAGTNGNVMLRSFDTHKKLLCSHPGLLYCYPPTKSKYRIMRQEIRQATRRNSLWLLLLVWKLSEREKSFDWGR